MKISFTGRHFEITKAIKNFAKEKLGNHLRFMDDIMEVHVVLSIEKYRHIAEITVSGKRATFVGKEETQDMYSSISGALEKIQKQAKRRKKKFTTRKRKGRTLSAHSESAGAYEEDTEEDVPRIVRESRQAAKPMTVEEAVLQMETSKRNLIVFTNSRSKRINVVYRRDNGDFGLIEAET